MVPPALKPMEMKTKEMITTWCHHKVEHPEWNHALNEIRSSGFWVMQGSSVVKWVIWRCDIFRQLRIKVGEQL